VVLSALRAGKAPPRPLRILRVEAFPGREDRTMRELTYSEAALEAIAEEMRRDPKIFYMSTDALPPLLQEFGDQRIRATPITEAALTGMAIGAAGCGFRPIVDWRQVTFCFVAMDQIVNQAAKIHYMFGGQVTFPILYRASVGGGGRVAAQHSQSPYSMFMNVAGLKMFLPSTPYDMKGLLKTAIRDNNPVISFESSRLMGKKGPVPEDDYAIPFGKADIKREGSDVTVVALAWLVHEALEAAEELATEGISVEIVDPRTLVPLDSETIRQSVRKTGRLVIADEAGPTAGFSAEIAAIVTEDAATFARLQAPVKRVCALPVPIPYSPILESHVFPDRHRIVAGIREVLTT
jgi:pyruvate/2-oxoglutarate/acetoin dehydrogenase E1 component